MSASPQLASPAARRAPAAGLALLALALAPAAGAAEPGALTAASDGWRWRRGQVSVELRHRDARWSTAEAAAVGKALDRLPDGFLRKATAVARVFYRDRHPRNESGPRGPNVTATTDAVAGYVSYGNSLLDGVDERRIYLTVTHELGHCAQYAVIGGPVWLAKALAKTTGTPGWTAISWTSAITHGLKSWNGFVSDYARTNDREDFAESVEFYWVNPDGLRRVSPAKYAFMKAVVFDGVVSPAAARVASHDVIAPVRPVIERLGDTVDTPGSLVKVHGKHFMGPLDGGYNTVRYRGTRTLHVPVSRTTVWSWVPPIKEGAASVTVTTQDGRSAPADFRVKKPWWKFW